MDTLYQTALDWLLHMEHLAAVAYDKAAREFQGDKELSVFLSALADEERLHEKMIAQALEQNKSLQLGQSEYYLGSSKRDELKNNIGSLINALDQGTVTPESLINEIIETELSEWNALFVYVVSSFSKGERESQQMASIIHSHLNHIRDFVNGSSCSHYDKAKLKSIPDVWEKKVLIVDDDQIILELHQELLEGVADCVCFLDAEQAIEDIRNNYYDLIIADYHMPDLNGMDFYDQLKPITGNISERFILSSSEAPHDVVQRCRDEGIVYLQRPIDLEDLYAHIQRILG